MCAGSQHGFEAPDAAAAPGSAVPSAARRGPAELLPAPPGGGRRAPPGRGQPGTGLRPAPAGSASAAAAPCRRRGGAGLGIDAAVSGQAGTQARRAGAGGRSYLQQVFVHDLQAAAAAHALVGGAAGARGHGPWRGGGRQRGGGRAGVLVGRRGARLRGSARETAVSAGGGQSRPAEAGSSGRPGPHVCEHLQGPTGASPLTVAAGASASPPSRRSRRSRDPQTRAGRGGTRQPARGSRLGPAPHRAPAPRSLPCSPRRATAARSLCAAAPLTFSEGPPSAGRSLSSSLHTNIGSLFQYMALPYRIPAPRRGRDEAAPGTLLRVSALSACRKKSFVFKGVDPAARGPAFRGFAGLTSCAKPAF